MKRALFLIVLTVMFCFGCKKDKKQGPDDSDLGLKIVLVQGGSQKDTVGNQLKTDIIVKITNNGSPVANYVVQFKRSGCEDAAIAEQTTKTDGKATYQWYLSGQTGGQQLRIILSDNNGNKKDSISLGAIGIAATHGWHRAGCVQNFPVNGVAVLNSGRLLSAINKYDYPYYSDDNAVSWHPLKSFSNTQFITKIIPGTQNDVFVATQQGLFFSNNNGSTWKNISDGIADPTDFADFTYTKSGKLIFSDNSGVYLSADKGTTWMDASFGLPDGMSFNPCEQLNGDLFIIGSDAELYKSVNGGSTWTNQGTSLGKTLLASVESIFIDDNGDMYIGIPHNGPSVNGIVYKSIDKGSTWKKVFSQIQAGTSYPNITEINKIGGNYYFSFAGRGVFQTTNFSTYSNITGKFVSYGLLSYTLAKNSNFVIGSPGYGIFYYVP